MSVPDPPIYRHLILGSGPAGLTAAIYAARSNCCPLLIQGAQPGGQLTTTTLVENFPGFAAGIDGPVLMQQMEEQARRFGVSFISGAVSRVAQEGELFAAEVEGRLYRGRTLIACTGAVPRMLGLTNEWELMGRGVSVCATCDAYFYKDKETVVVGGGDTALEEALFLARFARRVTLVHRRSTLRAIKTLQEQVLAHPRIVVRRSTTVAAIQGDREQGVTGVQLQDMAGGGSEELACDGVFIAIGHTPNTTLFRDLLELDGDGYIITRNQTETSVPGIFAAGDVQDRHFRQAITAAGSGCMAALQAERWLESQGYCEDCTALPARPPVSKESR